MIERVYRQVEKSKRFADIVVATDDIRIADAVREFGGHYQITSKGLSSGSDRVFEVLKNRKCQAVVNIQGDEPLVSDKLIALVYDTLATFRHEVVSAFFENPSMDDFRSKDIVKVVMDDQFNALYFSRSPIPFYPVSEFGGFSQHIGIYGYLRKSLEKFVHFPISELEIKEKLEQLRFLSNGIKIKMVRSECRSFGVDVPADIKKIENILKQEYEKN